ncbi:unnamed protein product [Meloidogyne enterolobii]|uniref:Uncharacterized protein n=1 Tax=Meloidogyne enterolobii TaxID=390850 RepID=A0ACB0YKS4_MELEN
MASKFYFFLIIIVIGFVRGLASANMTGNSTEITEDYLTTTSKKPTSISSNKNITETITAKSAETTNMEHKNTEQTTKETFPPKLPPPIFEKKNPKKSGIRDEKAEPISQGLPDNKMSQESFRSPKERIFDNMLTIEEEYKNGKKSGGNKFLAQQVKNNIQGGMDRIEGKIDDEFIGEETYALHYFAIFAFSLGITYLAYYNRRRIIGYLIEGKNNARSGGRYRRLSQSVNAANV